MDAIRVAKVEGVACRKPGTAAAQGTLHLTAHHLIFKYEAAEEDEMWVPYPLIALVTRLPQTLQGQSPLTVQCRTFRWFTLSFRKESDASDVFESVKELTVASSVTQLYAFFYVPNPPFSVSSGWSLYSPREEFARMGVGSRTKAWRFTDINKDYTFCPTYPARLVIPTRISDATLQYASKYRSKCRIPALVYLHWANYGSITRSSQPMVGITNNRSIQDEKLIEAIFQSHYSPESRVATSTVYGATTTNLIIDARPTTNAMANVAKGAGTENMEHYKEGRKAYLGVDNIHVMRDSLNRVVEALREADSLAASVNDEFGASSMEGSFLDRQALRKSGWLRHISAILDGTLLIVRNIHVNSSHVLIHCSDGWDRTAQLSSLAELCLDPYYRTLKGFQVLIEKDWLSFGHKFLDRCGHLSSDKFFVSPLEHAGSSGAEAAQAFLASVQNKLGGQQHLKETSPVFHQFLECVRQIQRQYPDRFEFNSRFLEQLHYHLYTCQFGTFLFNCERDRRVGDGGLPPLDQTVSAWDFFNSHPETEKCINPSYDPSLDNPTRRDAKADMGVLFPNPKDVRFWHELYGRTDEEMNGRLTTFPVDAGETLGPIDNAEDDPAAVSGINDSMLTPLTTSPPLSPAPLRTISSTGRRSTSPVPPAVSASMPNLNQTTSPTRPDSFRPFDATTSAFTLRPQRLEPPAPLAPTAPLRSSSPSRPLGKPIDLFGSGGMKSMWGKLSTNASAAYTAVQGAYDGVTKELKGLSVGNEGEQSGIAELGSRDRPLAGAFGEESEWTSLPTPTSSHPAASFTSRSEISGNSWRGSTGSKAPSIVLDNPWGTQQTRVQPSYRPDDIFNTPAAWAEPTRSSASLPPDPTVAHIAQPIPTLPRTTPSPFSTLSRSYGEIGSRSVPDTSVASARATSASTTPQPASVESNADVQTSIDPLGVGLLG